MDIKQFKKLPVMGILRGIHLNALEPVTESIISSGLKTVEITMNTPNALLLIEKMVSLAKGRLSIGAGTVLNIDEQKAAVDKGASFIVLPTNVPEVVSNCAKNHIPVFPGALTPQEIYNAWLAGASMVKVFPAKFFGAEYFKEVKGPFNKIELLACGGVTSKNIKAFFEAGASAVSFGASIFKKDWMLNKEFTKIEKGIRALLDAYIK